MVIKDKVQEAINKQINEELYSSYLYLAMSAYFETNNWLGFASWLKVQAKEENAHAMKFYNYLFERAGRPVLSSIETPPLGWKSPLDAFEAAYAHELKITGLINDLFKLAKENNDTATEIMLHWFINEQVEEEANALKIIDKLKLIKDSMQGLFMLDKELGERK